MLQRLAAFWFVPILVAIILPAPKRVLRHEMWLSLQEAPPSIRWALPPAGPYNVLVSMTGEMCLVDDMTWAKVRDKDIVKCDWKQPH